MTDKEKIEIDGINVLECEHYQYKSLKDCEMRYPESGDCEIGLLNYLFDGNLDMEKLCKDNPNCHYKQLARKTQECEELKKQVETSEKWRIKAESLNEKLELRNARYRKAIEEIEEEMEWVVNNRECYDLRDADRCERILDIINKAKGDNNENT